MIPVGQEEDVSTWPRHSVGSIVGGEAARLQTPEGRAARLSSDEINQVSGVIATGAGLASGLGPGGEIMVGSLLGRGAKYIFGKIPAPLVVVAAVLGVNGAIVWAITHVGVIKAFVAAEYQELLLAVSSVLDWLS